MHVFDVDGHELWKTSALDAAWTASDSIAYLTKADTSSGRSTLYELSLPSGSPAPIAGSYQNSMLGALTGRLAVPTFGGTAGFDVLNPAGGHFDGTPIAWSQDATKLAVLRGPNSDLEGTLEIVDVGSGKVTQTNFVVSSNGLTFDQAGTQLLACVFSNDGQCTPSLVDTTDDTTVASSMHGELANPGELADGRWIGRSLGRIIIWDPRDPTSTVDLGPGWPSMSPSGTVAVLDDASSPAVSPRNVSTTPVIIHLDGRGSSFPLWAPTGDRIAYSVVGSGTSQQDLEISAVP